MEIRLMMTLAFRLCWRYRFSDLGYPDLGQAQRRLANFHDLAMKIVIVADLYLRADKKKQRQLEPIVKAFWLNYFDLGDASIYLHDGSVGIGYDLIGKLLHNGVDALPDGWKYQNGILVADSSTSLNPDAVFDPDNVASHRMSNLRHVKEHAFWRKAFREDTRLHHMYVDTAVVLEKELGYYPNTFMDVFKEDRGLGKNWGIDVLAWTICGFVDKLKVYGVRRFDNSNAQLLGLLENTSGASASSKTGIEAAVSR